MKSKNTILFGKDKKKQSNPMVEVCMSSDKFKRFSVSDLDRFSNDYELIHCSEFLAQHQGGRKSFLKLQKIYLLLFQASAIFLQREVLRRFLSNYDFMRKWKCQLGQKLDSADKIILVKIARFLNMAGQQKASLKDLLNALILDYHEYRLFNMYNESSTFAVITCEIIEEFIEKSYQKLIAAVLSSEWRNMRETQFMSFYQEFSDICQIRKRIRYINCPLIQLSHLEEIPYEFLYEVEQNHKLLKKRNKHYNESEEERKEKETTSTQNSPRQAKIQNLVPLISVKNKIQGMNRAIRQIMGKSE